MHLSHPTRSAAAVPAVADVRLTPGYYVQTAGLGGAVEGLLAACRTVFDVKAAIALGLDSPATAGLLPAEHGVVGAGAVVDGAGARVGHDGTGIFAQCRPGGARPFTVGNSRERVLGLRFKPSTPPFPLRDITASRRLV